MTQKLPDDNTLFFASADKDQPGKSKWQKFKDAVFAMVQRQPNKI